MDRTFLLSLLILWRLYTAYAHVNSLNQDVYAYDTSWAIASRNLSNALGDKQTLYDNFIQGCFSSAGSPEKAQGVCQEGEDFRLYMNSFQPMSMRNYSKLGFAKIRAPVETFQLIRDFWEKYKHDNETEWHTVNTYHNMWESPPSIINVQEPSKGGGPELSGAIWESARQTLEEWTGMHLSPCSIWGIRIYSNNSILTPHVDRNPLVTSAIINVDQDVDEPWPLEVWGHDGMPYNISMEPGDMVLYESHTIIHGMSHGNYSFCVTISHFNAFFLCRQGRPFPMKGRFYANIFVHFEPLGSYRKDKNDFSPNNKFPKESLESMLVGLPPYVIPGSTWESEWRTKNPEGWQLYHNNMILGIQKNDLRIIDNLYIQNPESVHALDQYKSSPLHHAARGGFLEIVKYLCERDVNVNALDKNGWSPVHEAVRAGDIDVVKFLQSQGGDLYLQTGSGQSPLDLAVEFHGVDSEIFLSLKESLSPSKTINNDEL
jgi:prolyl 4-hydroxylase